MKRFLICLLAASICISLTVVAASSHKQPAIRFVPGEIVVKYKAGAGASKAAAMNARIGTRTLQYFSRLGVYRKKLPDTMTVQQALSFFSLDPDVEFAEPNYIRMPVMTPNDASFGRLWGLSNTGQNVGDPAITGTAGCDISACQAWDSITDGSAKIVAVLDTGIDINHVDITGNTIAGYDHVENNNSPIDSYGHGTHVAGTIGARGNNATGVTGINWTARIMPVRIGDSNGMTAVDIADSIDYARANGANIINASFGGYGDSSLERAAIAAAAEAGILFVAAAGNDGVNTDVYPHYPSSYNLPNVISVAATDQNDLLCSFSNYGRTSVHVGAPGKNIYSLALSRADHWTENFAAAGGWTLDGSWAITGGALTNRPYVNNSDSYAVSPVIDLTGASYCRVEFTLTGGCEPDDYLELEAYDGTAWKKIDYLYPFYPTTFDIRACDGKASARLRFHFKSDAADTAGGGFSISDLKITRYVSGSTNYIYEAGSSMASPHVAGMAALLWSHFPGYNMEQIRYMIINSVDPVSSLNGKIASGGRINIYSSMNLPASPSGLTATKSAPARIDLSWTSNSPGAAGFKIECKPGAGGSYYQIGTVPIGSTTYSHIGAPSGTTVYYRVRSYGSTGNSFYSNEASATTDVAVKVDGSSAGCFIATAAYGSPLQNNVGVLRAFRDTYLMAFAPGRKFVELYYRTSPPVADFIARHESARAVTRLMLAPAIVVSYAAINGGPEIVFSMLLILITGAWVIFRLLRLNRVKI